MVSYLSTEEPPNSVATHLPASVRVLEVLRAIYWSASDVKDNKDQGGRLEVNQVIQIMVHY